MYFFVSNFLIITTKATNKSIAQQLLLYEGIGKPEPLRENLSCYWNRRIEKL